MFFRLVVDLFLNLNCYMYQLNFPQYTTTVKLKTISIN